MRKLCALLMAVLISILLAAPAVVADWKQIKIATEGAYPPWNYFDESGKLVGFEIELIKDLCGRMNVECEIVTQKWRSIIEGLNKGKYDAIIAAMSITEPRKKLVTFSRSYADTPNIFVVRKDNPIASFQSELEHLTLDDISPAEQSALDALINAFKGKIIGVQVATINQKFADAYLGEHAEIRIYDFQHTVDLELYQGRLDALIGGMAYWVPLLKSDQGKEYTIVGPQMTGGPFGSGIGVAVRKKNQDLADMFSKAIDAALRDGTVKKLAIEWFTFDTSAPQ
ncbi:MAG: transporter substrate-binding domain-containing protein [Desulfobacterales bacterium]|nr:transporter substrate-binding domain-containing protein [Desulfobacterales bacterium]